MVFHFFSGGCGCCGIVGLRDALHLIKKCPVCPVCLFVLHFHIDRKYRLIKSIHFCRILLKISTYVLLGKIWLKKKTEVPDKFDYLEPCTAQYCRFGLNGFENQPFLF